MLQCNKLLAGFKFRSLIASFLGSILSGADVSKHGVRETIVGNILCHILDRAEPCAQMRHHLPMQQIAC